MLAGLAWAATLITAGWHIESYQKSLLSSLALLTSAAGAVVFGRLADMLGRKKVYGVEVLAEPRLLRWLVGASLAWLLFDFAYYGKRPAPPVIPGGTDWPTSQRMCFV